MTHTVRTLLAGKDDLPITGETGPRVLVELTLDELAFTSIAMDRAAYNDRQLAPSDLSYRRILSENGKGLPALWDRAYRDAHALLDQRVEFDTKRGKVEVCPR